MSASSEAAIFSVRFRVREAAMVLAKRGLSAETIREAMLDMAETEAEHAIAWAAEYDRCQALAELEELTATEEAAQ